MGGSYDDEAYAFGLDHAGHPIVAGLTFSSDFPATAGAYDTALNGKGDAFVARLSVDGGTLLYGTYLGGSEIDFVSALAVDNTDRATVVGQTASTNFPATQGAFDTSYNGGGYDAFAARLSS